MGRIYEALRPYMQEFCEVVDPDDLTRELMPHLRLCDRVGLHVVYYCVYIFIAVYYCFVVFP